MVSDGAHMIPSHASNLGQASLQTIAFSGLASHNHNDNDRLFNACQSDGLFYLDMRGTHERLTQAVEDIYHLEREIFRLPQAELLQYDVDRLSSRKLNGYKPLGRNRAGLKGGRDGFETYVIPKDELMSLSSGPWPHPQVIDTYLGALRTFTQATNVAAHAILSVLSTCLCIPSTATRLDSLHRSADVCTADMIRLLRYHSLPAEDAGVSHVAHTDLGSLTFLCTKQWGLQVQRRHMFSSPKPPDISTGFSDTRWEFVAPPPEGHMIVNLGDMMAMLTGGMLKSCLHRVIPVPGREDKERWSFARFVRAEDEVLMKPVESPLLQQWKNVQQTPQGYGMLEDLLESNGSRHVPGQEVYERSNHDRQGEDVVTSAEWLQRKFLMLRGKTWTEDESWILEGQKGGLPS